MYHSVSDESRFEAFYRILFGIFLLVVNAGVTNLDPRKEKNTKNVIWPFLIGGFLIVPFRGLVVRFRGQFNLRPKTSFSAYVSNVKNNQRQIAFPTVYNTYIFDTINFKSKGKPRGGVSFSTPRREIF